MLAPHARTKDQNLMEKNVYHVLPLPSGILPWVIAQIVLEAESITIRELIVYV